LGHGAQSPIQEAGVWVYLWDLVDEGIEATLDRLLGRGLHSLGVAVLYHAGRFLLPHNPRKKVYILEDGTAYFIPRGTYGKLKPEINSLLASGDPLAELIRAAHRKKISVKGWTVLTHNTRLGTGHPDCATVNAFGDVNPTLLCPGNVDVQQYCVSCCRDLLDHYDLDGLQIETLDYWGWGLEHGFHHEKIGIELGQRARWLLSLCFCPECLLRSKKAGVDVTALRQAVTTALDRYFQAGEESALDHVPENELARYQELRSATVATAVGRLRDEVFTKRTTSFEFIIGPEPVWQRNAGADAARLARIVDGLVLMAYYPTPEELSAALQNLAPTVPASSVVVGLQVCFPFLKRREQIPLMLKACLDRGYRRFFFYNFGLVPYRVMDWIGGALNELSGGQSESTGH
jgi:hypothetical protein